MQVKDKSVVWHLFAPEMYAVLSLIDDVYLEVTGEEAVMTSGQDAKHMEGSLHYVGKAADFRVGGIDKPLRQDLFASLKEKLGCDFDVVLEEFANDPQLDHVHVEYDVK